MKKILYAVCALSLIFSSYAFAGGEGAEDVEEVVEAQNASQEEEKIKEDPKQEVVEEQQKAEEPPVEIAQEVQEEIEQPLETPVIQTPRFEKDVIPEITETKCYELCKNTERRDACEENCPKYKPPKTTEEVYEHSSKSITDRKPDIEPPQQLEQEIQVSVESCEKNIEQNNLGIPPYNLELDSSVASAQYSRRDYSGVINNAEDSDKASIQDLLVLGASYGELEQYDAAIDVFNFILTKDPKNQLALVNRGITYEKLKNYSLALRDYELALKLGRNIKSESAAIGAGRIYYILNKYNESARFYKIAAKIKPNNEMTHYMLGLNSIKAKDWSEALYQIRELQQLESPYVEELKKIVLYYQPRVF